LNKTKSTWKTKGNETNIRITKNNERKQHTNEKSNDMNATYE